MTRATTTRRDVLGAGGAAAASLGGVAAPVGAGSLAVQTLDATNVNDTFATLNGDLEDLGGHDAVDVFFEYQPTDGGDLRTTVPQRTSSPAEFSAFVEGLFPNTYYEFRAIAEADGTRAEGQWRLFRTVTF